jgi:two-component system cell cycle sensor histidine kinase/response regulator CckA
MSDSEQQGDAVQRGIEPWRQKYEQLLEGLPDAVFVQDPDGNVISTNSAGQRLSGFERSELLQMNIRELLAPNSYDSVIHLLELASAGNQYFSTEAELLTHSGSRVPIDLCASIMREPEGRTTVQYVARDITARKRFEEALRHSETRFRLMATNLTEMVLAYDMERRLIFANPAAEALTGYLVSELEQALFICWVHPEDRERMLSYWEGLFEGKSFQDEEYRLVTKDGRIKWVAASWGPIRDDNGVQVGVQGRERDITKRRTAEETLRQSEERLRVNEERYRTLFESSPVPMWEEDFSGVNNYIEKLVGRDVTMLRSFLAEHPEAVVECVRRIRMLDVNQAARKFYGVSDKEELLGDLTKIFDEHAYEVFREEIVVLAEGNSMFQVEFPTRTLLGEERLVSMIVSLAASPSDDWSRVIVTFFDITDRRRLEEQLAQSQKLESLGRMAGGVAHDFNNLLTVITGYTQFIHDDPSLNQDLRLQLETVLQAANRAAALTSQLLAFSRRQMIQPRVLDLNPTVATMDKILRRLIGEHIELKTKLSVKPCLVNADAGQIEQVIMNLVANARDAVDRGGTITIETAPVELEPGTEHGAGPYILLAVTDTGKGMDEETRRHVFEPFYTTKGVGEGTGLGLASVFGIVKQHHGDIRLDTGPGKGTRVEIYLPRAERVVAPEAPQTAGHMGGSETILVVEDEAGVRSLICRGLENLGYTVLEAPNGREALRVYQKHAGVVSLVVTDVVMPEMHGQELAKQLQAMQPGIKVMYISGYPQDVIGDYGALDASVRFLQKPFSHPELGRKVRQVLDSADPVT